MDNICMIIKKREYTALQKELEELRNLKTNNTIFIEFSDMRRYRYSGVGSEIDFKDSIQLSQGIQQQVRRIVNRIFKNQELYAIYERKEVVENIKIKFKNLSWYKRLFFKPEYLD